MKLPLLAVPLAALLLLSGCASGGGDGRACVDVSPAMLSAIAGGDTQSFAPGAAAAVESTQITGLYVIAAEITDPGYDNEPGVWASQSLAGDAPIMTVDEMARTVTSWPGQVNGYKFSAATDGVSEAKACLKK